MMVKMTENTVEKMKEFINKNGPGYLIDEPYKVYSELVNAKAADRKTAGAILYCLISNIADEIGDGCDFTGLSKIIQKECCFNKRMSDRLAEIFLHLYSDENKDEWKQKDMAGLDAFMEEAFTYTWKGFSVWDTRDGTVACYYKAEIVLSPTDEAAKDAELARLLKKNPFMTKESIHDYFEKKIRKYLDDEFEYYCTCDDYYQPVVEDFEVEYCVTEWSEENGFEVLLCDGNGGDDGYEPKY